MYKVAILGTENSHALNFVQLINGGHPQRSGAPIDDFRVTCVYGETEEAAAASRVIKEQFPDITVCDVLADAVSLADAAMITARHGGDHLPLARPFIEAGKPCFIDKPFTITPGDAVSLVRLAQAHRVSLCGGSCCGFVEDTQWLAAQWKNASDKCSGAVSAPVNMKNNYGNFYFYSQHLVQIMCEIFGYFPISVSLKCGGETADGRVIYPDFTVEVHYTESYTYKASILCGNAETERVIDIGKDGYSGEVDTFCTMVRTGVMHRSYAEQAAPVFILDAMQASMDTDGDTMNITYQISQ